MSVLMKSIQGMQARVVWSGDCVELLELGVQEECGYFRPVRYEVHIPGGTALYKSESQHAARHYIEMLLG